MKQRSETRKLIVYSTNLTTTRSRGDFALRSVERVKTLWFKTSVNWQGWRGRDEDELLILPRNGARSPRCIVRVCDGPDRGPDRGAGSDAGDLSEGLWCL